MLKLLRTSEYRRISGSLSRLAEGDLSQNPYVRTSDDDTSMTAILGLAMRSLKSLVRAVDHSSKRLHGKMEEMGEESAIVSEQVEGVTSTIREMAAGMQDASEHMTGIADEMTRIHRYIEEVNSKNGAIVDSTVLLSREVAAGRQEIGDARERMNAIVAESASVHERMERLGQAVERIARFTQIIEEISGQTQLLALNANIEAARAGEQGAGFAVVAKEISALASQTKRETAGIREQIRDVTQGSAELKHSLGGMHAAVEGGASSLESASGQYGKIEAFLGGIVGDMREVDGRLGGVTGSTLAITDSVNQTSAMIQQVAAGSEEVLACAEVQQRNLLKMNDNLIESSRMSLALRSAVSQFKLPSQERNHPIQKEMNLWMETAMAIRAIMVSMIESVSSERIREWNRHKEQHEAIFEERMRDVESKLRTERDRRCFDSLRSAWKQFAAVKDQNAKWMLEGKREEAKAALVSKGRIAFKQAMDLAAEWMEENANDEGVLQADSGIVRCQKRP